MAFKEKDRERCDRCGKWQDFCSLVTLPEELYPTLDGDNEFSVCMDCICKYSLEQWEAWIPKGRKKFSE